MAKPWRLTRAAEASLREIAAWTFATFGPRQAAAYEEDLIACCKDIASGKALSRDCGQIIGLRLPENPRVARAGQHLVVFVEDERQAIIIDFLHGRSDLPRRLAALTQPESDGDC